MDIVLLKASKGEHHGTHGVVSLGNYWPKTSPSYLKQINIRNNYSFV